ncbi:hypothetical protein BT96DRAFT_948981 [Gymnopus androsaceus JB14]|uniref:Reverse transcriptase zinc-binding domain-containing protein n=1 Tax=Gymnopus androsaceus JB14 TaxID=1447944 RepID=A0A6A4GMT1_9AGAR|nr:hypothetical protein BT96DRAFT_948981 [Gymnopus androsaceus JB14]
MSKTDNVAAKSDNTKAKQMVKKGLRLNEERGPENRDDPKMKQSGIKLTSATQELIYKAISKAQTSMRRAHRKNPMRGEIWKGIRHKNLSREARYFLMMLTHNAYMIGTNWHCFDKHELQERATCKKCRETESLEHILTTCRCNGQEIIWNLANEAWEKKGYNWRKPDLGDILTCALPKFNKNKNEEGDLRFYRMLISESARLIWLIRNNWVINEQAQELSETEIRNKWISVMNKQLTLDQDMTHHRFEKKALSKSLVLKTWAKVLLNENELNEDWTSQGCKVLVGIWPR